MPTINDLKAQYQRDRLLEDRVIMYCQSMKALPDQAYAAACSRDENGKKHSHQFRLPNAVLQATGDALRANASQLAKCKSFDEIHDMIAQLRVHGFGPVAVYDTALRIGHCLGKLPDKVYLHAGTQVGADYFGIKHADRRFIFRHELPRELQDMSASQVEDFLCLYKEGKLRDDDHCATPSNGADICRPRKRKKRSPGC